jgi:hypothetical protein
MRKESTNHRNDFLMQKPCLLLNQCTRNHEFAIRKKPLVSMGLMQCSSLVKLGRERENNYYFKTLPLWRVVSIDDFLSNENCVENCVGFHHLDCPEVRTTCSYV